MEPFFLTLFYIIIACVLGIGTVHLWAAIHKNILRKGNVFLYRFMFIGYPAIVLLGIAAQIYIVSSFVSH